MARRRGMEDLSKYCIDNDLYDIAHFDSIKDESPKIQEAEKDCKKKCPEIPFLSQDFYSALYKSVPERVDERFVDPQLDNHREIIDMLMNHEDYKKLRNFTFLDEFASALGLVPLLKELVSSLPDPPKKGQGEGKGEGEGEGEGGGDGDEDGEKKGKGKGKGRGKRKRLTDKQKEAMGKAIHSGCKQASRDISDAETCMNGWGTDPGEIQKLPFKEKLALRDRLTNSEKMRKLSKMVGRAAHLALSAQKTKIKHGADEVYDIEMGSNLARCLPSEKMLLHGPKVAKLDFMRRFAEGKLMQYKLRSVLKEQKGPIVCCVDGSGSMSGNPELWSKAFALGLLEIAIKQKRKLVILHFGSHGELQRFDFSYKDAPLDRKINMAEFFLGGGTDFQYPLDNARKIIDEEIPKADVVMITDGWCDVSDKWLKEWDQWREKKSVKCYSIFIDENRDESPEILDRLSDHVVHAQDLLRSGDKYQQEIYELI